MTNTTSFDLNLATIVNRIQSIFDKDSLRKLAIKSGFIKRFTSRLEGHEIALALIEKGLTGDKCPLSICCDAVASINSKALMSVQSLQERINKPECADFFKAILEGCLRHHLHDNALELTSRLPPMGKTILHRYSAVKAIDCTEIALNSKLKDTFKGSGGEKKRRSLS